MKLVISIMTKNTLTDDDVKHVVKILSNCFSVEAKSFTFNYNDSPYCETDIDLEDLTFTHENLQNNLDKLISAAEQILYNIPIDADIIVANDDTETEVLRYEKNWDDVGDFGLFVTKRTISSLKPYYVSKICNAYLNLSNVSFGIYD